MKSSMLKLASLLLMLMLIFSAVHMSAVAADDEVITITIDSEVYEVSDCDDYNLTRAVTVYNGSYGDQLGTFSKKIYDELVSYYVFNRGTGSVENIFSEPITFETKLKNGEFDKNDSAYLKAKEQLNNEYLKALYALIYDYPELFWFKSAIHTFNIDLTHIMLGYYKATIASAVFQPEEITAGASTKIAAFDLAVNSVENNLRAKFNYMTTRQQKLKAFHDYICYETDYGDPDDPATHTAGAFFLDECDVVCEGYAKAFKILCDEFGIPCALVSGDASGPHMWNYVQMEDGKWYLVDVTWDDQPDQIYDTYFLAHSTKIVFNNKMLIFERTAEKPMDYFAYPTLSSTAYVPHTHSFNPVVTAPTCTAQGYTTYTCSCGDSYKGNTVAAKGHTKVSVASKNPTCIEAGHRAYEYCTSCSYTTYVVIPAKGHSYTTKVITPATHTTTGTMKYTCSCGSSYTDTIAKTPDHAYVASGKVAPNCTDKGYTVYVCICGDTYNGNQTNALGHDYVDGVCSRCQHNQSQDCNHMCHNNGLLWKLIRVFLKFFRLQPTCKCGAAHY